MGDVADILDKAADLIEPEGRWHQGSLLVRDNDGKVVCWCAMGAILEAGGGYSAVDAAEDLLELTEADTPGALRPLAAFNDEGGRTQTEVVTALREAAAKARVFERQGGMG